MDNSRNLEEMLSNKNDGRSKLKRKYKLGISAGLALPEVYSALSIERSFDIIPFYEYNFAYVMHATVTIPLLYLIAVFSTYLDITVSLPLASKFYSYLKDWFNT